MLACVPISEIGMKSVLGIVGELLVERGVGGEDAVVAHQQRVAVGAACEACSAAMLPPSPGRFSMMKADAGFPEGACRRCAPARRSARPA
jgi:hypothetical protein